jgi:hypothetical protein
MTSEISKCLLSWRLPRRATRTYQQINDEVYKTGHPQRRILRPTWIYKCFRLPLGPI